MLTRYVDGTAGAAVSYGFLDLGNSLNGLPVIGDYLTGLPPVQFLGSLDEVRLYSRISAGSEVQMLFQHSTPTPAAGLQLALDFEKSAHDSGPLGLSGSVNVHSDPLICSAVAAADGSWNCALSQDLPSGSHTVEISSNGALLATYRLALVDSLPITRGKLPLLLGYLGLLAGASPLLFKRLSRRKNS